MTTKQIVDKLKNYHCNAVVITGGEPFMQWNAGLSELHGKLKGLGYAIQYETSGKTTLPQIDDAMVVCSPKFIEGSWRFDPSNLGKVHYYKFLANGHESLLEIQGFIQNNVLEPERVYVMPMGKTRDEQLNTMETVFGFCRDNGYRMTPRLHILTFDCKRGV